MKKLISLGGNFFQKTIVKAAKEMGVYVIDVDYIPNNPAHKLADEYYNISTLDRDKVLQLAKDKDIDGIVSYASDISAPTAAYVAEKLELPTNPLRTVEIMCRKDRFREHMGNNGFYCPKHTVIKQEADLYGFFEMVNGKIIIKPSHASGSKGVSTISQVSEVRSALSEAIMYKAKDDVIIAEEYIERQGHQIAGDAFIKDGKIVYFGIANEHFDSECNSLVPVGESFPADILPEMREYAKTEIERALSSLGYRNGAVNLDFMFDKNGKVFIIELGPRNGGNLITDAIDMAGGANLAKATVLNAIGENIGELEDKPISKNVASYIWHCTEEGIYSDISIAEELRGKIIQTDLFIHKGDKVTAFRNGGFGIGAALMEFDSKEEMIHMMDNMNEYYAIHLM